MRMNIQMNPFGMMLPTVRFFSRKCVGFPRREGCEAMKLENQNKQLKANYVDAFISDAHSVTTWMNKILLRKKRGSK